jgi:hypothetical protein
MVVIVACRIWDLEKQGVHTEVQDASWFYGERFSR